MIKNPRKRKKILREGKKNGNIAGLCEKYGISRSTYYRWKARLDAGESLSDKSKRPKKVRRSIDSAIEKEIVQLKENNPKMSTREVKVKGFEGRFVSNATVWKIWTKHGFEIRKNIPLLEIVSKLRNKKGPLTEKEERILRKKSQIYRDYGRFLEKDRGMKLMGKQYMLNGKLFKMQTQDSSVEKPLVYLLVDCETLLAFFTVGDRYTISRNATLLLKHILNLMARKGRNIKKILDFTDRYEKEGLQNVDADFCGSSFEGERLLESVWKNDFRYPWYENIKELQFSRKTGQILGVAKFIRNRNRIIYNYPLMGDSPLEAWKKLTKDDPV